MKITYYINAIIFLVAAATLTISCKNDSEEDLLPENGNTDFTPILLNEICGAGSENEDPNGEADWIEIFNNGTKTVNLGGVTVEKTDEDGSVKVVCTFSTTNEIAGGGYLVISYPNELSAKISNKKPLSITLRTPSGDVIDVFDRNAEIKEGTGISDDFGNVKGHRPGGSYARIPNGGKDWAVVGAATRGAENVEDKESNDGSDDDTASDPSDKRDYSGLALNELNGNDKFIELYNASDMEMDLSGVQLKKDDEKIIWIAPEGTVISAKGFVALNGEADDYTNGFTGGLSADKSVKIELLTPSGQEIDVFKNPSESKGEVWGEKDGKYDAKSDKLSFGRFPDGTGKWYLAEKSRDKNNLAGTVEIEW